MTKDNSNFPSWVNVKPKKAKVIQMSDLAEYGKALQSRVAKANSPKLVQSSINKKIGEGDYTITRMYDVGELSPVVQHLRKKQKEVQDHKDAEACAINFMEMFFNFDKED